MLRPPRHGNAKAAKRAKRDLLVCGLCVLCVLLTSACGTTTLFRQYEYEEEIYLSLDGSATVYVNSSRAALFAWSTYQFRRDGDQFRYLQTVGASAGKDVGSVGWNGSEIVAFRLHLPSKIRYHNTGREVGRGNILVWEQPLADRLRSVS